jgi:hypothetical protein
MSTYSYSVEIPVVVRETGEEPVQRTIVLQVDDLSVQGAVNKVTEALQRLIGGAREPD